MKTYLVPIDFSAAGNHAAEFAAALSHQTEVEHIVLLNAYYVSVYETMLPSADMVQVTDQEIEQNAAVRLNNLELVKAALEKKVRQGVRISVHLNRSHLLRAVIENVAAKKADLVILGTKGNSSRDDARIGSHVVRIAKASPVPVVVVPPAYGIEDITNVVVACDFQKVTEAAPLSSFINLLNRRKFNPLVVNIDNKAKTGGDAEKAAEKTALFDA